MEKIKAMTAGELIERLAMVPRDTPVLVCEEPMGFAIPALSVTEGQFYGVLSGTGDLFYGTDEELQGAWEAVTESFTAVLLSPLPPPE